MLDRGAGRRIARGRAARRARRRRQERGGRASTASAAVAELGRGFRAYRAGDYHAAIEALSPVVGPRPAQRRLGAVPARRERVLRRRLRVGAQALRSPGVGKVRRAAARHRALAGRRLPVDERRPRRGRRRVHEADQAQHRAPFQDQALARFRLAELAAAHNPADAAKQFLAIHRNFPAHPLADEALKRAAPPKASAPPELPPEERIKRAEALSKDRHWTEALDDLAKLPAQLPGIAGRRARLPDRHDQVPHAPRLPGRGAAAAGGGAAAQRRSRGVGGVSRRARAVARRPRRRSDRRLPQGRRDVPALALRGRGAVPGRAGSTSTAGASARACPICRPRSITSARATSPTTPPGAWRSRTTCWARPIRRSPASRATRSCRSTTAPATSAARA